MSNPFYSVDKTTLLLVDEISTLIKNYNNCTEHKQFICDCTTDAFAKIHKDLSTLIDWNFDFKAFYFNICNTDIPLEILWKFHIFQIIPFDTYLLNFITNYSTENISENIIHCILQDIDNDLSSLFYKTGILAHLINRAFPVFKDETSESEIQKVCKAILKKFLLTIFTFKEQEISSKRINPFFTIWQCGTLDTNSLNAFCYYAFQSYLTELETTETDAYIVQENIKIKAEPFHLMHVAEKIIRSLTLDELEFILKKTVWMENVNWKHFLVSITVIMQMEKESIIIKNLESILIKTAFECLNPAYLQRALLIGRQISFNSSSFAVSFGLWLQEHFVAHINFRNFDTVAMFIQAVSNFIPYENNVDYLKVLLEKSFTIPTDCQSIYLDYTSLLKTRIKDLQPSINADNITNKALNVFAETGKIPPFILEASLMNKKFYLNEFLPVLLAPRILPSVRDVKAKFIDVLNKSGKIPSSIFQKYKLSCQQKQQNLLAGIDMTDDNSIEFIDEDVQIIS